MAVVVYPIIRFGSKLLGVSKSSPKVENFKGLKVDLQLFAKKKDIKQIEAVVKKLKMTKDQRRDFGDYIEYLKERAGKSPDDHSSFSELLKIGKEFLGIE